MESKILIDISYSTREPQIIIQHRDSDDPRDKLLSMFTGQSMPGVRDGYCRIERSHSQKDTEFVVISPLDPVEAGKHIPFIKEAAISNACIDLAGSAERIAKEELKAVDLMCRRLSTEDLAVWEELYAKLLGSLLI